MVLRERLRVEATEISTLSWSQVDVSCGRVKSAKERTAKNIVARLSKCLTSSLFSMVFIFILCLPVSYVANGNDNVVEYFPS